MKNRVLCEFFYPNSKYETIITSHLTNEIIMRIENQAWNTRHVFGFEIFSSVFYLEVFPPFYFRWSTFSIAGLEHFLGAFPPIFLLFSVSECYAPSCLLVCKGLCIILFWVVWESGSQAHLSN